MYEDAESEVVPVSNPVQTRVLLHLEPHPHGSPQRHELGQRLRRSRQACPY
jgi:hypothetical protein